MGQVFLAVPSRAGCCTRCQKNNVGRRSGFSASFGRRYEKTTFSSLVLGVGSIYQQVFGHSTKLNNEIQQFIDGFEVNMRGLQRFNSRQKQRGNDLNALLSALEVLNEARISAEDCEPTLSLAPMLAVKGSSSVLPLLSD